MRLPKCGARGTLAVRALPPAPLAAEDRFALTEPTCGSIRSPSRDYIKLFAFTGLYQSVRLHGTISDHFFFGPGFERKLANWTIFSVRVIAHERHISLSFHLPPSVGLLLTIWTRFSVRVIAHERHLSLSFYLPPSVGLLLPFGLDFLYASTIAHERHLSLSFYLPPNVGLLLTIWTRFSVRVIAHERHLSLSFYPPPSVGLLLTI